MALAMATRSDGVKSLRTSFSAYSPARMLVDHVHDPSQDGLLLEYVPALPLDEFKPVVHPDGPEQPLLANALGQGREVAHVPAMAAAHLDVGDFEFFEHGMVCPSLWSS